MAVISDKRISLPQQGNPKLVDHYEADISIASDYYPFGMNMPGRSFENRSYHGVGFNGELKLNEVYGEDGNAYDYGMRIYDAKVGRFLSVDPLTSSYPWYTPYQFAGNKPIWMIDLDGAEEKDPAKYIYKELTVDISKMPDSYTTKSGKLVTTQLRQTSSHVKDNRAWFWDQIRSNNPDIQWSLDNTKKLDNGLSPVADDVFVEQFGNFKEFKGQTLEMNHLGQKMEFGVGMPWQPHRGAGFTKFWHQFGKTVTLTGIVLSISQIGLGDPLMINDITKPQELSFLETATKVGLSQNNYSDVVKFASANNSRTNSQLPSSGVVGVYYASPTELLDKQFLNLTNIQAGSFITGGWGSFYSDAKTASGALNKTVTHAVIFYRANGKGNNFVPVNLLQIAPLPPMPQQVPVFENTTKQ